MNYHRINHTMDESIPIWRYMEMSKFSLLVTRKKLWFSRGDLLGDEHEGTYPECMVRKRESKWSNDELNSRIRRGSKEGRKHTYVSCWTKQDPESFAMWKIYTPNATGIAIQSTFNRLKDSLKDEINDIFIGKVEYIDYDKIGKITDPYLWFINSILRKRKVFKHEQELRAFIRKIPKGGFSQRSKPTIVEGIYVPVDLNILIDKIFLAPTSPQWQFDLLKSMIPKYQLNKKVIHSSLDDKSYFL